MKRQSLQTSPIFLHGVRMLLPLGIVAGSAVAAAVIMLLFYYQPAQDQLGTAREGYETARQSLQRFKTARKTYEELQQVWRMLPARAEFAELVMHISETAQQDNVAIPGMMYSFQIWNRFRFLIRHVKVLPKHWTAKLSLGPALDHRKAESHQ